MMKGSRIMIIMRLVVLSIACAASVSQAKDDEMFRIYKLSIADKLLQHWVEDLDGDGLEDIFVVHTKGLEPDHTRWVSIFWHDAERGFGGAPDQSWELDEDAAVLDIGDVAGDASKEICFLTGDGVRYYPLSGHTYDETPVGLLEAAGLAVYSSKESIPMINFVRDWDGDGRDEIGVATFEGLWIYRRDTAGTFGTENRILVEVETRIGRRHDRDQGDWTVGLHASYEFPTIQLLDFNGDGRDDLLRFFGEVFGFTEMPTMTKDGELLVLRAHSNEHFVYLHADDDPMRCPPADHFGMSVASEAELDFIDDKTGKPIGINTFIGRRPIAAFGNSDGDREMLEWTAAGGGASLMGLVFHDDGEREYAYGPASELPDTHVGAFSQALMDAATTSGWVVISMKKDWKRIFAFDE